MNRLSVTSVFVCVLTLVILTVLTSCANKSEKVNATPADALTGEEVSPGIQWVTIPAGEFTFGSPEDTPCRAPIAETEFNVRLTRSFIMADSEITQAQWESLDLLNPSKNIGENNPVTFVNFFEALVWCNKLSRLEGLDTCYDLSSCVNPVGTGCGPDEKWEGGCSDQSKNFTCKGNIHNYADYYACPGYRLPTTAEWEYAAKAGTTSHTYNGDVHYVPLGYCEEEPALEDIAWYCNNSDGAYHPVKQKQPNPWGLYDTLGNVYEFTDYYTMGGSLSESTNSGLTITDPIGNSTGTTIELRGGTFDLTGCYDRPARPLFEYPHAKIYNTGFRPVRTLFEDSGSQGDSR